MTEPVRVDVWSDVACPWCLLGHAHLQAASSQSGVPVDVTFHSYQLNPEMTGSRPAKEHVEAKYGDKAMVQAARQRLTDMGAQHGIHYDFDAAVASNTFDAHRLHHFAMHQGKGDDVMQRMLRAMHEEGQNMADHDVLQGIGEAAGLDADAVQNLLQGDSHADDVRADLESATRLGIRGVPFFVLAQKYALSGAQPVEVFMQALQTAAE